MRIFAVAILSAALSLPVLTGCAHGDGTKTSLDAVRAQLIVPTRSEEDRTRDARDHPDTVLAFAGFGRGDTIADIFGGGGYYSEILSGLVGPDGHVLLVNNAAYDAFAQKDLGTRLADNRLQNVTHATVRNEALGLGENRLDGASIVMSYHDLYYVDPQSGWAAINAGQFLDQIVAALKPGAKLLVVDHAAREGTGKSDAQTLHRIDEQFAIKDFRAHGLEFVGSLPDLRNEADDRSLLVFDPAIRGKTDRFVHLYRKP